VTPLFPEQPRCALDVDAADLAGLVDALIVGSWLKEDSDWRRSVALERIRRVIGAMRG
jgi:predicted TIM-barrel enzyme